ncbi:hypothetical protein NDU88_000849 [Pleurodeles waltl]|uniref:Uncharacterized protein n=1 Tax=Pleurodeles waltl TaxID=8319 RepID=A0AAV7N945_PLEWA|nr:hypothetical protein NDU88_000849 [Pleurodeles waltl]
MASNDEPYRISDVPTLNGDSPAREVVDVRNIGREFSLRCGSSNSGRYYINHGHCRKASRQRSGRFVQCTVAAAGVGPTTNQSIQGTSMMKLVQRMAGGVRHRPERYYRGTTSGPAAGVVVKTGTSPAVHVHASLPAAVVDVNLAARQPACSVQSGCGGRNTNAGISGGRAANGSNSRRTRDSASGSVVDVAANAWAKVWSRSCPRQPDRYYRSATSGPAAGAVVKTGTSLAVHVHASLPAAVVDVNPAARQPARNVQSGCGGQNTNAGISGSRATNGSNSRRTRDSASGSVVDVAANAWAKVWSPRFRETSGRGHEHSCGLPGSSSRCTERVCCPDSEHGPQRGPGSAI